MRLFNQHSHTSSNGNGTEPPNQDFRRRPTTMDPNSDPGAEDPSAASSAEGDLEGSGLIRLSSLLENPEELEPPEAVVEKLAWRGRLSVLAALQSSGKSTLTTAATAAVTTGSSLFGEGSPPPGEVLYYNLEEALGDLARRMVDWQSEPDRVVIQNSLHGPPIERLWEDVCLVRPTLVVIDSLTRLATHRGREPSTDVQWQALMGDLAEIARRSNAAVLVIHHGRRSDGRYRGSSAIADATDMLLEMTDGTADNERKIEAQGRLGTYDFSFRLVDSGNRPCYRVAEKDLPLDDRVLRFLRREPGYSMSEVQRQVRGAAAEISRVLHQLQAQGLAENRGGEQGHAWHVVERG